ncbi:pimeloyl-ACP methyl ester carboxylesterase [Kutzneria buriramensis]|uniref:Pimeloyl-ACP methyl ester carboxylesterase n=1 Tax=Kutzneria buriramensis TaxID=1045776 RepID=A0A3E0HPZ9_9PSEU|nr:pimeloyl-ACP methyl ester carboxylesterase [Kutzneria buriramensis]
MLLLPGLACRAGDWDAFADHVGDRFELWDVELPWHGVEDLAWTRRGDLGRLLAGAVADAGTRFDAIVAHSFSASLLLEVLAAGMLRPVPVVLVSPLYRASADDFDWATISHYLNDFHLIFAEALTLRRGGGRRADRAARLLRDRIGPYGWTRFFELYLRSPLLDLGAVTAPGLVLCGDGDIATRSADCRRLAAALPDGEYRQLARCGHFPMAQRPGPLADAVAAFLDDLAPRRTAAVTDDVSLELM